MAGSDWSEGAEVESREDAKGGGAAEEMVRVGTADLCNCRLTTPVRLTSRTGVENMARDSNGIQQ